MHHFEPYPVINLELLDHIFQFKKHYAKYASFFLFMLYQTTEVWKQLQKTNL